MKILYLVAAMSLGMAGSALANPITYNYDVDSNYNSNYNSAKQRQNQDQSQAQVQGQKQSVNNSVNSRNKVNVDGNNAAQTNSQTVIDEAQRRNPVSTAYAPPPVASEDTCMGSTTAGGQGVSFGISFGTTWEDKNCKRLKNSRELNAMGMHSAACMLLSRDDDVARAIRDSNTSCLLIPAAPTHVVVTPPVPPAAPLMVPVYPYKAPRG